MLTCRFGSLADPRVRIVPVDLFACFCSPFLIHNWDGIIFDCDTVRAQRFSVMPLPIRSLVLVPTVTQSEIMKMKSKGEEVDCALKVVVIRV